MPASILADSAPQVMGGNGSDGATADPAPATPPPVAPSQAQTDPSINAPAAPASSGSTITGGGGESFYPGGGGGYVPLASSVAVIGTTTLSCPYLTSYMTSNSDNTSGDVIKLQTFLKNFGDSPTLPVTGIFDQATVNAVKNFQTLYAPDVLSPWSPTAYATGQVYITTLRKINEIACGEILPLTSADMTTIDDYKNAIATEGTQNTSTANTMNMGNDNSTVLPLVGQTNSATNPITPASSDDSTSSDASGDSAMTADVTTSGLSVFGQFLAGIFWDVIHFFERK